MRQRILDVCCGSRMFWFDKHNPDVVFMDSREISEDIPDGRRIEIKPDIHGDFRNIPYNDNTFSLVVFDPPHLKHAGKRSWLVLKYGILPENWEHLIKAGFVECMRVLKPDGVLCMKWSDGQIGTADVLRILPIKPLFGFRRGRGIFLVFMHPKGD